MVIHLTYNPQMSRKLQGELILEELLQSPSSAEGRRFRAEKRKRNEDCLSPLSSPLSTPKTMHRYCFDSDSTEIESDLDDSANVQRKPRFEKQGWVRKESRGPVTKTQDVIKSDGEEPTRKTWGRVRSGVGELATKIRGEIRSDGEEPTTKKQFIRSEVRERLTQSKSKLIEVTTSHEEESDQPRDVGGARLCEGLTPVKEEKEEDEVKMAKGTSYSVLTTTLAKDTTSVEETSGSGAASSPVTPQGISNPTSSGETQVSSAQPSKSGPSSQKVRSSSRLRRISGQYHSTPKLSSVATRTRGHRVSFFVCLFLGGRGGVFTL